MIPYLDDEKAVSVIANAIGFEMLKGDREVSQTEDGVDAIMVSVEETNRCKAAARRVIEHLHQYGGFVPLPTNGRSERRQLYRWMVEEEVYVENKYASERDKQDDSLQKYDIDVYWVQYVSSYYDRARLFLKEAFTLRMMSDPESVERAAKFERMALQAIAKGAMTAKDFVESAIRVFGDLPKPGLPSGYIEVWNPICESCQEPIGDEEWVRLAGSEVFRHLRCENGIQND